MNILPRYRIVNNSFAISTDYKSIKYINKLTEYRTDLVVLEPYIDSVTPISHKFLKCNHVVKLSPKNAMAKKGCRKCRGIASGLRNKKDHDEYVAELSKTNPTIICMGRYITSKTPLQFKCSICGHIWVCNPGHLIGVNPTRCPKCPRKVYNKKSHEQFMDEYKSSFNTTVEVVGRYEDSQTKIKCKCLICGEYFTISPTGLRKGHAHQKCSNAILGKKKRKTHKQFEEELFQINPNIRLVSLYKGSRDNIECHCKVCGNDWSATPSNLTKAGCPKCGGIKAAMAHKYTRATFVQKLHDRNVGSILYGDYLGINKETTFKCLVCDGLYKATPHHVITGHTGCLNCNMSKGERKIHCFLTNNEILFEHQKRFPALKGVNNGSLIYDFYLPKYNKLIEYQGAQHERPVNHFGGEESFITQQIHDRLKREYAKNQRIDLVEIWYYDYERIEEILTSELKLGTAETAG